MDFRKKIENFSERKIYLGEYIEAKLPQAFRSSNNKSVDNQSSILLALNVTESVENSTFTIPDLPMKRVESSHRKGKVSYQNRSKFKQTCSETSQDISDRIDAFTRIIAFEASIVSRSE